MSEPSLGVSAPAAGWYPDPADPSGSRWWSGEAWTDHVQPAAVAAVPAAVAPVVVAAPAMVTAPALAEPARPSNLDESGVPLNLFADSVVSPAALAPAVKPTSQYDWHNQTGRGVVQKRHQGGSVSLSTGLPSADAQKHNPYQRNWLSGVALVLAILSIGGLAVRTQIELPALSQSIFAGAPIAVSLLALALSIRAGRGIVISIVAVLIAGGVLVAGLLVDPAVLKSLVDSVLALLP